MIKKTTPTCKVQGAYKPLQASLGGKERSKNEKPNTYDYLTIFQPSSVPLAHPTPLSAARGPSAFAEGEALLSAEGRQQYIQLCLIPWKYPARGS